MGGIYDAIYKAQDAGHLKLDFFTKPKGVFANSVIKKNDLKIYPSTTTVQVKDSFKKMSGSNSLRLPIRLIGPSDAVSYWTKKQEAYFILASSNCLPGSDEEVSKPNAKPFASAFWAIQRADKPANANCEVVFPALMDLVWGSDLTSGNVGLPYITNVKDLAPNDELRLKEVPDTLEFLMSHQDEPPKKKARTAK